MDSLTDPLSASLRRVPGLFRRWELTEILKVHRTYLLEEAGHHADGSPLLAVYVGPVLDDTVDRIPDPTAPEHSAPGEAV